MNNDFINKFDKILIEKKGCNISISSYDNLKKIKKINVNINNK